jgi:hypothetical protein
MKHAACGQRSIHKLSVKWPRYNQSLKEELISIAATAPALHSLSAARVARISLELIVKRAGLALPSEAEAMLLVARVTSIRLPNVYRYFTIYNPSGPHDSTSYIIMDYVEGRSLHQSWSLLSLLERDEVVKKIADMIHQLQSLRIPQPGPICGGPSHRMWFTCRGRAIYHNTRF